MKKTSTLSVAQLHLILVGVSIALTGILYLNGGATSPFISLYLVPIAIAAATLSARFTVALAAFCLLAYSLLMFYYQPLQALSPSHEMVLNSDQHSMHISSGSQVNWHVVGMWMNFVLSTGLICWFVLRMARALRAKAAELAAIREKQLRDEQLLGIAALAAGTLHELSTPLATMTLLVEDFKSSAREIPALAEDANLLSEQLERCRKILQNLARAAERPSGQLQRVTIDDYLNRILVQWAVLQPGIPLKQCLEPVRGAILVDSTFDQAIINLLNNAAEANPTGMEISCRENIATNELVISIRDHGAGVDIDAQRIGKPFVSTRGPGRGLGLFLSNATVERLGGKVMLQSHPDGGTTTTVTLPLV
ncbi:MAG: sensor histidine kinase [Halioglobus sp.]|nr:sensor histidine kinase [Halioglobus sp.]